MLGISIYPEKENQQATIDYINLAAKYGFKRVFTCLLSVDKTDQADIITQFKPIIDAARKNQMEVIVDVDPSVFSKLNISYDDLSFFAKLNVTGIRLDQSFDGRKEAMMTYNPYDLDIEINMSGGTKYIDNILSYHPNSKKLIACHNFYPMAYSGLSLDHFIKTSQQFKTLGIRSAAFVSSPSADHGPWPIMDRGGLCTLEMHRDLPITTQVKHYLMMDLVDDIIIGNAFASEAELKAISELKIPTFDVELVASLTPLEKTILLEEHHFNRGDLSDALIRSSTTRIKYQDANIGLNHNLTKLNRGDIAICNNDFLQYKGELQLVKQAHLEPEGRKNIVAKIVDHELFLIDYLKAWKPFKFQLYDHKK